MYIDNNNTVLGSGVPSETHCWLQAIYSHNTRIIFDKKETGQRRTEHQLLSKYYSH